MDGRVLLLVAVAATLGAGGYWLGSTRTEQQALAQHKAQRVAEHRAGPLIAVIADQDIGPGQSLRVLRIRTGPLDDGSLDPRCLLYTDAHGSSLTCPGVQSIDLMPLDNP